MSSTDLQEFVDLPREFLKDGLQFVNRCQKRAHPHPPPSLSLLRRQIFKRRPRMC
jgi:hypothetical protein